ncbi:MAG: hypothetical protein J6U23_02580 [Clostridiales bacterium]|nr:hypothetical protein [Clostridiales bacterium]
MHASGKEFWSNELSNFRFTGEQVGVMFFLSDEMNGFNFCVGYLNDGGLREGAVLGLSVRKNS